MSVNALRGHLSEFGMIAATGIGRFERVPLKWNHLSDKDAAQIQTVDACRNRKSRATFSWHALGERIEKAGSDATLPEIAKAWEVLAQHLEAIGAALAALDKEIAATHAQSPVSRLLASIPGDCRQVRYTGLAKIGKIAAAIAASAPEPSIFKPGRDFSAWLGSTPRQNSSGGKEKLGAITQQGNRTIRRLLVPGGAIAASDCGGATSLVRA
jgi:transposase